VQVASNACALLGGRQAPLALGLSLGPQRALLELGKPLSPQSRPVPGEPGGCPDDGPEEKLGREPVADQVRREQGDEAGRKGDRPDSRTRLVTVFGDRVEGNREADRRAEAISEPVQGRSRRGHEAEYGKRREAARGERQRSERGEGAAEQVEVAVARANVAAL
jgi:hypothetical protein